MVTRIVITVVRCHNCFLDKLLIFSGLSNLGIMFFSYNHHICFGCSLGNAIVSNLSPGILVWSDSGFIKVRSGYFLYGSGSCNTHPMLQWCTLAIMINWNLVYWKFPVYAYLLFLVTPSCDVAEFETWLPAFEAEN